MKFHKALLGALIIILFYCSCNKTPATSQKLASSDFQVVTGNGKVVFIELGSVNCVPCRAMQPIMDEIRQKYGNQVDVRFYDVWTPQGEPYGRKYGIRVIPTQVFLDKTGKEYFRHEGFFPLEEVLKILELGGANL
mgnify:CR=1 FL=1